MQSFQERTDVMNALLRGELAATATYQQALEKVGHEAGADELRDIYQEHWAAVDQLRQYVRAQAGEPDQESGLWGAFARAVEGGVKILDNTAALKALQEGEEHGLRSYEDALQDQHIPADCKTLIRSTLLPQTRSHIQVLNHLMERP
jgi:uncharacterized protein (TIGR02284 family)